MFQQLLLLLMFQYFVLTPVHFQLICSHFSSEGTTADQSFNETISNLIIPKNTSSTDVGYNKISPMFRVMQWRHFQVHRSYYCIVDTILSQYILTLESPTAGLNQNNNQRVHLKYDIISHDSVPSDGVTPDSGVTPDRGINWRLIVNRIFQPFHIAIYSIAK